MSEEKCVDVGGYEILEGDIVLYSRSRTRVQYGKILKVISPRRVKIRGIYQLHDGSFRHQQVGELRYVSSRVVKLVPETVPAAIRDALEKGPPCRRCGK